MNCQGTHNRVHSLTTSVTSIARCRAQISFLPHHCRRQGSVTTLPRSTNRRMNMTQHEGETPPVYSPTINKTPQRTQLRSREGCFPILAKFRHHELGLIGDGGRQWGKLRKQWTDAILFVPDMSYRELHEEIANLYDVRQGAPMTRFPLGTAPGEALGCIRVTWGIDIEIIVTKANWPLLRTKVKSDGPPLQVEYMIHPGDKKLKKASPEGTRTTTMDSNAGKDRRRAGCIVQ